MVDDVAWDEDLDGVRSPDNLRRMWKPQKEIRVENFLVVVAWSKEPVPVVISRWLESDERREVVIRANIDGVDVVYVYAHALETERGVVRLLRVLDQEGWCGSRDRSWALVRACEQALHIEREAWLEAHERDQQEAKAFLDERSQRFAALAAASAPATELTQGRKGHR